MGLKETEIDLHSTMRIIRLLTEKKFNSYKKKKKKNRNRLTLNDEGYPFADGGRDFVAGNAEVRPHLLPRYVLQKSHICAICPAKVSRLCDMSCKSLLHMHAVQGIRTTISICDSGIYARVLPQTQYTSLAA